IDTVAGFYLPALRRQRGGAYAAHLLRQQAASTGFDGLDKKLAAIRHQHGLFAPTEDDLNAWGYRLLGRQQLKQALAVFQLGVQLYPQGANGHDSLAEAYEADGATALAVTHYRRSLELDPGNKHAVARLRVLAPD
ncbi:hypothetical protein HZZ02_12055, partial [Streptococcus danieliae]|nr:hypothetical protein [Streptococcus danieliae]